MARGPLRLSSATAHRCWGSPTLCRILGLLQSTPVWEKAEQDVAKLEGKLKEKRRQLEEEMAGPGNTSVQKMQRNRDYVLQYFQEHFMVEVPKVPPPSPLHPPGPSPLFLSVPFH